MMKVLEELGDSFRDFWSWLYRAFPFPHSLLPSFPASLYEETESLSSAHEARDTVM